MLWAGTGKKKNIYIYRASKVKIIEIEIGKPPPSARGIIQEISLLGRDGVLHSELGFTITMCVWFFFSFFFFFLTIFSYQTSSSDLHLYYAKLIRSGWCIFFFVFLLSFVVVFLTIRCRRRVTLIPIFVLLLFVGTRLKITAGTWNLHRILMGRPRSEVYVSRSFP